MVLGLKLKHKKGAIVKIDYIVHVQEIKPWPPSDSLRSVHTVLLQWENGDQNSGSFQSVVGDHNIGFNESFMLPLSLKPEKNDKFQKNYLEFNLLELLKDKSEGQIVGTTVINLADHVSLDDIVTVNAPIKLKKNANGSVQPALTISLEPVERDGCNPSTSASLSKEASLDNDDTDFASCTDEDTSSPSSRRLSTIEYALSSSPLSEKDVQGNTRTDHLDDGVNKKIMSVVADASEGTSKEATNSHVPSSNLPERSMSVVHRNTIPSPRRSSMSFREVDRKFNSLMTSSVRKSAAHNKMASKDKYHDDNPQTAAEKALKRFDGVLGVEDEEDGGINSKSIPFPDLETGGLEKNTEDEHIGSEDSPFSLKKVPVFAPASGNEGAQLAHTMSAQIDSSFENLSGKHGGIKTVDIGMPNRSQTEASERKERSRDEWNARAEVLEEELREAAAIELALYSTVSEHSSSGNKVHSPARRLSRFYKSFSGEGSQAKQASAAKSAVSGLILVSRACGNDVPRLTFWLSNAIMLRALVSQNAAEVPRSTEEGKKSKSFEESDDWEDTLTFIMALENVESWLFSRVVESIWWQTFTPHMQPTVIKLNTICIEAAARKTRGRRHSSGCYDLGNFSIELWKRAFKDSCERLCPIRASGHECGCLASLVVLVMEQLVNRLDVAMFNAILRESDEEMPTDPVSDPISDPHVLPIPSGKPSFTSGAQLKNVIGNWSRWLSDLFGLEDRPSEDGIESKSFKAFRLLHALSDLMMLPYDMLADASTRKEVCPVLGPAVIKRVLKNFIPDEFFPKPIPRHVIAALDSEGTPEGRSMVASIPCHASPTIYSPPSAALMTCVGEVGSQVLKTSRISSVKKSHNSDDELDELDSALTSIIPDSYLTTSSLAKLSLMPQEKHGRSVLRYELLRQVWKDDKELQ